jgi:hypothetical protein
MDEWLKRLAASEFGEITHGRTKVKFSVSPATFVKRSEILWELIGFCEGQTRK